ncbi:DUF4870 domain-containing protein [Patescibacteria group bacterium]|nr:DUF4870 domain-containing protein [Patescibacteria group bacterium]
MAESGGNEKMMGALAYFLGPVTGIIMLLTEKKNAFIRFHAMQSTVVFGAFIVLYVILGIIPVLGWIIALILSPILTLVSFILWLMLMWKAYNGEKYKLPYFGDLAERQLIKLK